MSILDGISKEHIGAADVALMNIAYCMMRTEIREIEKKWREEAGVLYRRWTSTPETSSFSLTDKEYQEAYKTLAKKWQPTIDRLQRIADELLKTIEGWLE